MAVGMNGVNNQIGRVAIGMCETNDQIGIVLETSGMKMNEALET